MFKASCGQILISQGDTGMMTLSPDEKGYIPKTTDRAIFTVRDKHGGREYIKKTLTPDEAGKVVVVLYAEDTRNMKPGTYVWDMRYILDAATNASGDVTGGASVLTPIPPSVFQIVKVVGKV